VVGPSGHDVAALITDLGPRLDSLGIAHDDRIISAHRTPERLFAFAKGAKAEEAKKAGADIVGAEDAALLAPSVEPQPPELPDVAEEDPAAIRELQSDMDVTIVLRAGRQHEELPGHLHLDRQDHVAAQR